MPTTEGYFIALHLEIAGAGSFWWNGAGKKAAEVTLPAGLRYLGGFAFNKTPWLEAQPDGMVYLNGFAYTYKGTMPENTEITLKKGTKRLCLGAFCNQPHLTGLTLPDSITALEPYLFHEYSGLRHITLPKGLTELPESICQDCISLETINIPANVITIGGGAFWGCGKLREITLPKQLRSIGDSAFEGCESLTEVVIPDSVTELGAQTFFTVVENGTFKFCSALKGIVIPDSVKEIRSYAFCDCGELETVSLPASMARIYNDAFACNGQGRLETIRFAGTKDQWVRIEIDPYGNDELREAEVVCEGIPQVTAENLGDVDADGNVTSADARLTLRFSVGLEHFGLFKTDRADYDRDGSVTPADARLILRASVGL